MVEFWNEEITNKSYQKLIEIQKEFEFVLIGGWAIYLYTKAYKSKDIDIIIDYSTLGDLKNKYTVNKNEFLHKYEIKQEFFDIDIYLPKYSKLSYPEEKILKEYNIVEGFRLPKPEVLILLKLQAYENRKGTIKGKKDGLDIALLMIHQEIDYPKLFEQSKEINKLDVIETLNKIIRDMSDKDIAYLKINRTDFLKTKKKILEKLK